MKPLTEILGDVEKGIVLVIYFGRRESYVGVVADLNRRYFSLRTLGDDKKPKRRINFKKPEFYGKEVRGYERFIPGRE